MDDSIEFKSLYFSAEEIYNLRNYKYIGSDEGYLYKAFFNPVANFIVEYVPAYVAPNTLTMIGFGFTVSIFATMFGVYGIDMDGEVGRWWYFYSAFAFLGYRIFDEMDGKQARRTKNSSVLGMVLDHGCDSFSCLLLMMASMKGCQMGSNLGAFVIQIVLMGAFLFIVLEEYYKGYFKLGPGNAVSDGSAIVIGGFLFSGIMGY
jgi:ethanolaminephosphotransferase